MSVKNCHKCGAEVDVNDGGCAMMIAFCRNNTTNLINLSFCRDCYDMYIDDDLSVLNANANLGIIFGEEGET